MNKKERIEKEMTEVWYDSNLTAFEKQEKLKKLEEELELYIFEEM